MAFKANTTRPRVSSRTKNIARSLGYMVIDVGKDLNPTIARIHSDTKTMLSDVKTSMREMNSNSLSQATKELLDPNGQNVVNNLINDFKTGNWYNKEREDNAFFDDADFDFGGDEDWGDDEQSSSSDSDYSDNSFSSSLNGMKNLSVVLSKNSDALV